MYASRDRLIVFDADGTVVDAFAAIDRTFSLHGMAIGDLERFQKRRNLFKYLGGLKEFPRNLTRHFGKNSRQTLLDTLTEVYREEATLYAGLPELIGELLAAPDIRLGLVTRNVTHEPRQTLGRLFARHGIDLAAFDFIASIPLGQDKAYHFRLARQQLGVNPARSYACGDEHKDYFAAISSGIQPFIVAYGFEDWARLTRKFHIPEEIVAHTPDELCRRLRHALDLT